MSCWQIAVALLLCLGAVPECAAAEPFAAISPNSRWCCAYGDIHYHTFDGAHFHYQDTCKHLLVGVYSPKTNLPSFSVYLKGGRRYRNNLVSWPYYVEIEYGCCNVVRLTRSSGSNGVVATVNGVVVSGSYSGIIFQLRSWGSSVRVTGVPGLTVYFNGNYFVHVSLSTSYSGQTSGMCGNFDRNATDDYRTKQDTHTTSGDAIGDSWAVYDPENLSKCSSNKPSKVTAPLCVADSKLAAQCDALVAPYSRKYSYCGDSTFLDKLNEDCKYDECQSRGQAVSGVRALLDFVSTSTTTCVAKRG